MMFVRKIESVLILAGVLALGGWTAWADDEVSFTLKGTAVTVDHVVVSRGFSFWWYFGSYETAEVFGVVMEGEWKGQGMMRNDFTRRCRKCKEGKWQMYNLPDEDWLKKR